MKAFYNDGVYNVFNSMIKESKYFNEVMKKLFNKELVMTKKDNEDFENSTKCWICSNDYIDVDVKLRDHCNIIGKYRDSITISMIVISILNPKFPIVVHILKNYNSHLIMEQLGKLNLKTNVNPNGLFPATESVL